MPAIDITLIYVLCVIFIATVIRSAFGFGEALVNHGPILNRRCSLSAGALTYSRPWPNIATL